MTNITKYECLVMVYQITEYRAGCVYRTKLIGPQWVPMGMEAPAGFSYTSPNEREIKAYGTGGWNTIRRVSEPSKL